MMFAYHLDDVDDVEEKIDNRGYVIWRYKKIFILSLKHSLLVVPEESL